MPGNPTNIMPFTVSHAPETCKRWCLTLFVVKLRRLYFPLRQERFNRGRFSVSRKPQANLSFLLSLKFFPLTLHHTQVPACFAMMQGHF